MPAMAELAVRRGAAELPQLRAAGPDDDLADPAGPFLLAARVLRREPLVVVVVAVDHELRAVLVEQVPERRDLARRCRARRS